MRTWESVGEPSTGYCETAVRSAVRPTRRARRGGELEGRGDEVKHPIPSFRKSRLLVTAKLQQRRAGVIIRNPGLKSSCCNGVVFYHGDITPLA